MAAAHPRLLATLFSLIGQSWSGGGTKCLACTILVKGGQKNDKVKKTRGDTK